MINEIVMSPVKDTDLSKNLNSSPIWKNKNAYKPEEVTDEVRKKHEHWYEYHIKFDGLIPIQVTKFKVLS